MHMSEIIAAGAKIGWPLFHGLIPPLNVGPPPTPTALSNRRGGSNLGSFQRSRLKALSGFQQMPALFCMHSQ